MIVSTIFGKIISIFIIMLVGVLCYKLEIVDNPAKEKLSKLITLVINPILIFMSFQMTYDEKLLINIGILFLLAFLSYFISIILAHFILKQKDGYDSAVEKFAVTYTNCGFIGIPLSNALFGSVGTIYTTVFISVFHILCWTHGISLLDQGGFCLKKLINPCLIAVILGMISFLLQIKLPENIAYAMNSLGNINTPMAMLVSGMIVAQLNLRKSLLKKRIYLVSFLRLIVSPAIFCVFLRVLPLDETMRIVAAMTAACPSGAMTITMAVLYERDDHYATELFGMTTILSLVTIPLCVFISG